MDKNSYPENENNPDGENENDFLTPPIKEKI
jgi:hypothetical protein